jgi:hypothetical protein
VQTEIYLHVTEPAGDFPSSQSDKGFQLFDKLKEDLYVLYCHEIYHAMFKRNSQTKQVSNSQNVKASEDANQDVMGVNPRGKRARTVANYGHGHLRNHI